MIVGLFPELLAVGGVQTAGRHTAAVLAGMARERGMPYRFLSLNDPPGEHEVRVGGMPFTLRGFHRAKVSFFLAALGLARRQPRLVVAAHPNLAVPAVALKWLAPSVRVLVMTHGVEVWNPLPPLRRKALGRADRILAPSTDTAQRLAAAQGLTWNKIARLPWGLDPDFLALADSPAGLPLPAGFPKGRVLLTVGRWDSSERYKGVNHLIRVMPRLLENFPDLCLVAVGEGEDRTWLESLAREVRLSERVHFLAGLSKSEIVACYAHAEVFALPSGGEGFGIVFLEAMALGKPVVGGAHGGTSDIVLDGETGLLVPHGDEDRLTDALERLFTDKKLREQMGLRGRQRLLQHFRFENFQVALSELLRGLLPG